MDTDYYKEKVWEILTDQTYYKKESKHPENQHCITSEN